MLPFEQLCRITLSSDVTRSLGLSSGELLLRRGWPRSDAHLLLEYETEAGQRVPGQWMHDTALLSTTHQDIVKCAGADHCALIETNGTRILLQVRGADRKLKSLAGIVQQPDAALLVHRPERRAVVRVGNGDTVHYLKIMRSNAAGRLIQIHALLECLSNLKFGLPRIVDHDQDSGTVTCAALSGEGLFELLSESKLPALLQRVGTAVRSLHDSPTPNDVTTHTSKDEINVLHRWLDFTEMYATDCRKMMLRVEEQVFNQLHDESTPPVLSHRDLFDKQIFLNKTGDVGILDFDTLALAEAALDLANVIAHLELRVLQGKVQPEIAQAGATAFLDGYQPSTPLLKRLNAYIDASRLRLACVYAFRPKWQALSHQLCSLVGTPHLSCVG